MNLMASRDACSAPVEVLDRSSPRKCSPFTVRRQEAWQTRKTVLGDDSLRRNDLCVVFDEQDSFVPVVTYFVTRIFPIAKKFRLDL